MKASTSNAPLLAPLCVGVCAFVASCAALFFKLNSSRPTVEGSRVARVLAKGFLGAWFPDLAGENAPFSSNEDRVAGEFRSSSGVSPLRSAAGSILVKERPVGGGDLGPASRSSRGGKGLS